jgi:hypothetical protein
MRSIIKRLVEKYDQHLFIEPRQRNTRGVSKKLKKKWLIKILSLPPGPQKSQSKKRGRAGEVLVLPIV